MSGPTLKSIGPIIKTVEQQEWLNIPDVGTKENTFPKVNLRQIPTYFFTIN
jgi:hypothetical protein